MILQRKRDRTHREFFSLSELERETYFDFQVHNKWMLAYKQQEVDVVHVKEKKYKHINNKYSRAHGESWSHNLPEITIS